MISNVETILFDPIVGKIITTILGILVINGVIRFFRRLLSSRIENADARFGMRQAITFFGYLLTAVFLVAVFSDQFGSLTVAFGVAGAGIAFALQEVIASVAGWTALSLGQFYGVGDRVQLGGIKGDVIDIGVLRTTIMEIGEWVHGDQYNGRIVRVANSFVFKEAVYNYSGDFPFVWDEIAIPIRYESDHQLAREILEKAVMELTGDYTETARKTWNKMIAKYAVEQASVTPAVTIVANDNWVEYSIRYVVAYQKRRSTKNDLFTKILEAVARTEGRVSFASATFELVGAPQIQVAINTPG